jgi:hypothetical protein
MSKQTKKTISREGLLGQQGINLIESVVLEMGSRWSPSGANEAGIDGYIEFFDPVSREALGTTVAVQSKATASFKNETSDSFDFWCDRRDLGYWLAGNMPVVLIVSRPQSGEAYWVSVKDYFGQAQYVGTTRVRFSKSECRFTVDSLQALIRLGGQTASGLYLPPLPKAEQLFSNLLPLSGYPEVLFIAPTNCQKPRDVWQTLPEVDDPYLGCWTLHNKQIVGFVDLTNDVWAEACKQTEIQRVPSKQFAQSSDEKEKRLFVQVLNQALRNQLHPIAKYWPIEDCFAYAIRSTGGPTRDSYNSLNRKSKITVVTKKSRTKAGKTYDTYRHLAFTPRFRRFEGEWFLEITPTYRFTSDGFKLHRFHEELLSGIKRFEGNRAVLSSVLFWADKLQPKDGLFATSPILKFEQLLQFGVTVGIDDSQWMSRDEISQQDDAEAFLPFKEIEEAV